MRVLRWLCVYLWCVVVRGGVFGCVGVLLYGVLACVVVFVFVRVVRL